MKIGLIVVGDEILSGKRQDKHFEQVIKILTARGLALSWAQYAGDNRAQLTALLKHTLVSDDLVFSCGGIGATPDDHTRQSAAKASGVDLELHPVAAARITERTVLRAREGHGSADMSLAQNVQRLTMGEFPAGADVIENPYNKIPGFSLGHHHFLPGFPVMAWPMIEQVLDQRYRHLFGQDTQAERAFLAYDLAESVVTPYLEQLMQDFPAINIFCLPSIASDGQRSCLELGVKGKPGEIESAFEHLRTQIESLGVETSDLAADV